VSSANLTKRLLLCVGVQSWVSRGKSKGLRMHPWGAPVFRMMVLDALLPTRPACGLLVRKSSNQFYSEVFSPRQSSFWRLHQWTGWPEMQTGRGPGKEGGQI